MKEKLIKMPFGSSYIKNYHANYNSYFPLKAIGLSRKNIFIHEQRLSLELVFLMKFVLSQNPITVRKFKTDEIWALFLKSLFIVDTFVIYSLIALTMYIFKTGSTNNRYNVILRNIWILTKTIHYAFYKIKFNSSNLNPLNPKF